MLRSALALLTTIAVLWHATAGCCAHHAHCASQAESAETPSCCGHDHAHSGDASHDHDACEDKRSAADERFASLCDPSDSGHGRCGDRCSFPQPEGNGVALLKQTLDAWDHAIPSATLLFVFAASPTEDLSVCESPPPSHVGAALRRHLALGVLIV